MSWLVLLCVCVLQTLALPCSAALPQRLILLVDGVSYRDMKALQEGVTYTNLHGRQFQRQAFHQGYFPVSRIISTFPSISDPSWSEILGIPPPPGYQRTYFDVAQNSQISLNGVTSSVDYEKEMTWQKDGSIGRFLNYLAPQKAFQSEIKSMIEDFLETQDGTTNYYALIHSTDSAQHLSGDIFAMLSTLDEKLQQLRAIYRSREGRELEILLLSDHGTNRAGRGKRVKVQRFLKQAGYRISTSLQNSKDVILPTAGIESWIEIHNSPTETETLIQLLSHLEGVDVITARIPNQTNRFLVMNSKTERATIEWNPSQNSFRYSAERGDPLNYQPILKALAKKYALDSNGFASAESWMTDTLTHKYPLGPERIVRGHTQVVLNTASILVSLKNGYVHSGWLIQRGVALTTFGGTHGALDDLASNGILLSSFAPTQDTSSSRVAALFDGFPGRRNSRGKTGAAWIAANNITLTNLSGLPDEKYEPLPNDQVCMRVWTPHFTDRDVPLEVTIEKIRPVQLRRWENEARKSFKRSLTLTHPLSSAGCDAHERNYVLPADLALQPKTMYRISGQITEQNQKIQIFKLTFRTDSQCRPIVKTGT